MDEYEKLHKSMMENKAIRKTYDEMIIKDITFAEWVDGMLEDILLKHKGVMERYVAEND